MGDIVSMTGFGKGEYSDERYKFILEIKTVNNRYSDIHIRMPRHIRFLEDNIRKTIKNFINRGRVDVSVNMEIVEGTDLEVKPNVDLAIKYKKAINELSKVLGKNEELDLRDYINLNDIIEIKNEDINEEKTWECLNNALDQGLSTLNKMRILEGKELALDMINNIDKIVEALKDITSDSKNVVDEYKLKLETRINEILKDEYNIDENRLYNEIAIYADKVDINEEIIRLESHIKQLKQTINTGGTVGRKLDFILQEANREINTIGSKTQDLGITKNIIEVKNLIEKIREQAQNIE
ncbi:MAG: YicC/YloC family endoribonuclease [Bacillota bacterium]|nr:YicC/YloC family endoribonuclease [Bacillota bacterium]